MKKILIFLAFLPLASCAAQNLTPKENLTSAYNNKTETTVNIHTNIPQSAVNEMPVIQPPIIQPMWIPPHVTQDKRVFVTGHWIFVQLNNPQWYINQQRNPIHLGIAVQQEGQ